MATNTVDRLSHLFSVHGTRRSACRTLLGTAGLALAHDTAGAKGKRHARAKHRDTARRKHNRGASAQKKARNACTTPFGLDLNALYGVSAQIVNGFCAEVGSGEKWIAAGPPWFVNDTFESVPEDGFQPAPGATTPLEDFRAKFTELKLVIDPDTKHEETVRFPTSDQLFTGPGDAFPGNPEGWVLISPIALGTAKPLPVGDHVVDVYWVFSDVHCDGVAPSLAENCFPAGDTLFLTVAFKVKPGHH
jgi:hypothetical protein